MPKNNNSLTQEQLSYMNTAVNVLNEYRSYIQSNDVYIQANLDYNIENELDNLIDVAQNMGTPVEYETWLQEQNRVTASLKKVQEALENSILSSYYEKADKKDTRPVNDVLNEIIRKQEKKEALSPEEETLKAVAADYERVIEFRAATEKVAAVNSFAPAPLMKNEEAQKEAAPQKDPESEMADGLTAFVTELQDLESWGHHDQWKAMKEALKQAKALADHLPENKTEANERILSAMNLLQQTAMNYVVYKAAKNPSDKDLQRLQMAERMVGFAAQHVARLEPKVEEADKAVYISKSDLDALRENARLNAADIEADNPLRSQLTHIRDMYDVLSETDRDAQPDSANYQALKQQLDRFSDPAKNPEYRNMIHESDERNWKAFQSGIKEIASLAAKCTEEQRNRNDYSEAAIRRKNVLYQLGNYTSHLRGAHLESIRADNQAAFRQRVARCRAELAPLNESSQGHTYNSRNLYTIYAGYLYERALRNGVKTPEDDEIIRSVEEKGHFYPTEGYSYAKKLMDDDKKAPDSITSQWLNKFEKQTVRAMRDEKQAAEICEAIAAGKTPQAFWAKKEEERQKLPPEERNVLTFREEIEDKRDQLGIFMADYTKENFKDDAAKIIQNCYQIAVASLFEAAASRETQGKATGKDKEVLDAVRSGKGLEYAITLKNQGLHSLNDVMADWLGAGHITYETAKAMTSPEDAAKIIDKITQGVSPEIPEEKRTANAKAFLKEVGEEQRELENTLLQITQTGRILDVKEKDFADRSYKISASCYKIYIGALYSAASKHAKDGTATEEDRNVIQAVESGKAEPYIENLMQKDKENPDSITAKWFIEEKITLNVANDMTKSKERIQEIFDAITKGKLPAEEKHEISLKSIRLIAANARDILKTDLNRGGKTQSERHSKLCYNIYTAYLYEKALKSAEKTDQEKAVIKAVESDNYNAFEADSYASEMMENDFDHPENSTAKMFLEKNLDEKTLEAMSDEKECKELCENIFIAKANDEIRAGYVNTFRKSADEARDRMSGAILQKGKALETCLKEARIKDKDYSKEIFTAYVCDLYDSLPKSSIKRTPEQKFIADQVENGEGSKLVDLMRNDKFLCSFLDFQNIGKENFENALRKGELAKLAKSTALVPIVQAEINQNLSDPDMTNAKDMEPTLEEKAHISEVSYCVYAAMRYIAAKQMQVSTKGSASIVKLVEKYGVRTYAKALKDNDPKAQGLFEPSNLKTETINALYSDDGRKAFVKDIMDDDIKVQKQDVQKNPQKSADSMSILK